ncbi:Aste57867_3366 [Aphanomyces stellatus]|uniref:Aste57867_3366 protein n=1 Tax=Aphanomyces stellatus TaxID=120398 RepID=A0A485KDX1_9STRA|nr:hypothetical protein As57867_003356 [Aphanomyces stellatus]VFT80532.1 Aste57867_3366 [Aphanomyces stellatus]
MKLLIDTDGGLDDAVSILATINFLPPGTVVAITTVYGNVDLHQATFNVKKVLEISKDPTIPVYSGAHKPLVSDLTVERWDGHGPDGLGGAVGIAPAPAGPQPNDAVHALIKYANMYPGELVLLPIGPATNIALATAIDPTFALKVAEVLYMGCTSKGMGNITPHAEFNVACDPEAVQMMLDAFGHKVTVVSWELTTEHGLSWSTYDELTSYDTQLSKFLKAICASFEEHKDTTPFVVCDAYAAAILIHPDYVLESKRATCRVELAAGPTRGACHWTDATTGTKIVLRVDTTKFVDMLRRLVQSY